MAAALSVDLGRLAQEKRRYEKVADLAALDAVRDINNHTARAQESALRNSFPVGPDYSVVSERGTMDANNDFVPSSGGDAVRVTVRSPHKNGFLPGGNTVQVRAAAASKAAAGFKIGSTLASVDPTEPPILNRVLGTFLGGNPTALNLSLISYQGLVAGDVSLGQLATQMGFGTVDELLEADMTMGQLLDATAVVLNNEGDLAGDDGNQLRSVTTNSTSFKLGDFITVAQGFEGQAAAAGINVFELINASAQVANQNTFLNAGATMIVPVTGRQLVTSVGFKVIEGPTYYFGPVGGDPVSTSQVEVTLTPASNVNVLGLLTLSGNLPVKFVGAGATGTMDAIVCSGLGQGITVGVNSQPVTSSVSTTLSLKLLDIAVADAVVGPAGATSGSLSSSLPFAYPSEFTPTAAGKSTPTVPVGFAVTTGQVTVNLLGSLPLGVTVANVIDATLNVSNPTISAMANQLTTPAFRRLGFKLGGVDVQALLDPFEPTTRGLPALVR